MFVWELRVVTYITNILVLIGYAMLFSWLRSVKFKNPLNLKFRDAYIIAMTIAFLLLFHVASLLSMVQTGSGSGYGWTYLNFQIGTVMFALIRARHWAIFDGLAFLLFFWFWWLPNTPGWLPFYLGTFVMMVVAKRFGKVISEHPTIYFPFSLLFAVPFFISNRNSLGGNDAGWVWQIATSLLISLVLWLVQDTEHRHRHKQEQLMQEARVDDLTNLFNFRVFNEDLYESFMAMKKTGQSYALYTLDIDHFKQINDRYGHLMGNRVLEGVTKKLKEITDQLEYPAVAYRTGGEEFSFVLHDVQKSFERACEISQLVHDELGSLTFTMESGESFHITISLGQDRSMFEDKNYLDVYRRADKYLYHSKNVGRNAVTVRGTTIDLGEHPQLPDPDVAIN